MKSCCLGLDNTIDAGHTKRQIVGYLVLMGVLNYRGKLKTLIVSMTLLDESMPNSVSSTGRLGTHGNRIMGNPATAMSYLYKFLATLRQSRYPHW